IVSPNPRLIDSAYPGLPFSIHKFLHDPRGIDNNIFEIGTNRTLEEKERNIFLEGGVANWCTTTSIGGRDVEQSLFAIVTVVNGQRKKNSWGRRRNRGDRVTVM
ncbi:unnamed protein product, partial [Prunus brigantina]